MMKRPGKITWLECFWRGETSEGRVHCTTDTVGKDGLLSITAAQNGTFILEYEDKFLELKPTEYKLECSAIKLAEVK